MKEDNHQTTYKGGYTKFENRVREIDKQTIAPTSKLIFLIFRYIKTYEENFTPSYLYMKRRFGINDKAYKKALIELSEAKIINYSKVSNGKKEYLKVDILIDNSSESFESFPVVFLESHTLTIEQKVLLCIIWGDIFKDGETGMVDQIYYSATKLFEKNKKIGFSKSIFLRTLKQISTPDSGYINVFSIINGCYKFNMNTLLAMYNINSEIWSAHKGKTSFPIYIKPLCGDWIMKDGHVIDNRDMNKEVRVISEENIKISTTARLKTKKMIKRGYENVWQKIEIK